MTLRADLRGQTPREVLFARRDFINTDLQWRQHQWTFANECTPALDHQTAAYRCAGFGTHSNVVYFDLMRALLSECWQRARAESVLPVEEEIIRLEKLRDEWMAESDEYQFSPGWILECERHRMPIAMSGEAVMLDHDCPVCQMAAEPGFGPMFWHLDGHHMAMEDNWVFSFHATREEWEAEQREWEEMSRAFSEKEQRKADGNPESRGDNEPDTAFGEKVFDDRKPRLSKDDSEDDADDIPF